MSYHAASGIIAIGLHGGIELWQTDPCIAPAPRTALPDHMCVRERLSEAHSQAKEIETSIEEVENGLRQQMSREQESRRSYIDHEATCTHLYHVANVLTVPSGERENGIGRTANISVQSKVA